MSWSADHMMVTDETPRERKPGDDLIDLTQLRVPGAVRVIDLEDHVEPMRLTLRDGRPYRTLVLLVRCRRCPLAVRTLSLDEQGHIAAPVLSAAIASVLESNPAHVSLEAHGNGRPESREAQPISVVVTTCGNEPALIRCVSSVLACEAENVEVIVVDNRPAATSTQALIAERFGHDARVRYVKEPRPGLSHARNTGLRLAENELVAFTDDDVVVDSGWLDAIATAFHSGASCVTGLIMPLTLETATQALFEQFAGFGKGLQQRSFQMADSCEDPLFPYAAGTFGSGANTALRRSVALGLGGFDVKLGAGTAACGGEDLDMYIKVLRSGGTIVYTPAATIFHEHPSAEDGLRRRVFSYGVGLTAMLTKQMLNGPRLPLLRAAPAGVSYALDARSRKNASRGADYPKALKLLEQLGMLAGPPAYAISARRSQAGPPEGTTLDEAFAPSVVSAIELERPLDDIELGLCPGGRAYGSLLALVRLHGDPLTMIEVPASQGRVSADALLEAIWSTARGQLERHALNWGCVNAARITPNAIASGLSARGRCAVEELEEGEQPFVSVIVPTARRPERVRSCLESLQLLRYPSFEMIVVDNAPDDPRTRAVVEQCAVRDKRVRYVAESLPGSSTARNRGVREAKGELLAFTDDDAVVDPQWLRWIVGPFLKDERVGVVTGLVLPARFDTAEQRWFEEFSGFGKGFEQRLFDTDEHRADGRFFYPYWGAVFGSGNNMAFRRELLRAIGGFDPALGPGSRALAGEDVEAFSRAIVAGARLAYEPRAVCWHDHRADAAAVDRQVFSYGVGLTAILTKWLLRDPRLARVMLSQSARFLKSLSRRGQGPAAVPHELARLGAQLRMNRNRNTLGLQVQGYCVGPVLYIRSVIWARRRGLHRMLSAQERP